MDLDEAGARARIDPCGTLTDVADPASRWREAIAEAPVRPELAGVDAIVVAGMGGSGFVAEVAVALARATLAVPVLALKGYELPAFARSRTLVVGVSHSGSTEETRAVLEAAGARGCARLAVAGPGRLGVGDDVPLVPVTQSGPPRHAIAALLVPVLRALGLDQGEGEAIEVLEDIADRYGPAVPWAENPVKQLASRVATTDVSVAIGSEGLASAVALRYVNQLAENAKLMAIHATVPEAHHNLVVSLERSPLSGGLVELRDPRGEPDVLHRRYHAAAEADVVPEGWWRAEFRASGRSPLARVASLVATVDLASVYAALALGRDPTSTGPLDRIKGALGAASPNAEHV
ncbi:hypothetical protein ER308_06015 [Egibacter rhizosphaerae]|uniref:SIS domain-containing protein n=1 Tax=Egibacter rhizosphaerae TaxID=1670831 RepID=A0A411YD83_9ACTN|nr:SIS domain-containing protein [Egibacter rhizosphaerae]QBI19138.1 hypothetical protein ER308_06015 [Egibacter rhizosphaerae]